MITYLSLFLVPILATVLPIKFNENSNKALLICFTTICAILIGFKYQVGGDWGVYEKYVIGANAVNLSAMLSTNDPGFMTLLWISSYLGLGQTGVNLFCSSIFMYGVYKICKNQPLPWLALVIAFPYLITVVGFGYTRQSMTIGLLFLVYCSWIEDKKFSKIKMISLFLFGFLFHKSILIFSPIIFLQKKGLIVNKFLIAIFIPIVLFLSYYYFSYIQMIWKYYVVQSQLHTTISENHQRSISYGSSIRSYLNIPAILLFFLFFKNFRIFEDRRLLVVCSLISISFIFLTPYGSTLFDRLGLYLIVFQLLIYSRIPLFFKYAQIKQLYIYVITSLYLFIFLIWFNYANSSIAWKPYQIVFFKPTYYQNSYILSDEVLDFNVSQAIEQLEKYKLLIDKYGSENVFNINNSDDVLDGSEEVLKNDDINKLLRKDKIFKY